MYFYFSKEKAQTGEKFIECYYCVPANGNYKPTSPHLSRPWIVLLRYPERVKCFNWVFGSQLRANVDPLPVQGTQLMVSFLTIHILITCATTLHKRSTFTALQVYPWAIFTEMRQNIKSPLSYSVISVIVRSRIVVTLGLCNFFTLGAV